jgi:hypothetical protein
MRGKAKRTSQTKGSLAFGRCRGDIATIVFPPPGVQEPASGTG